MRIARRFVASLVCRPQLIEPGAGAAVLHALLPGARLQGWDGEVVSADMPDPRQYQFLAGTAIIPVVGELVHRGSGMDAASGLCSYQALDDMLCDAFADSDVTGILLDIDSPGGEASGVLELSAKIAAMAACKRKPIKAMVNSRACSAAYAIASGCNSISLSSTGIAGSIGVVLYHADVSKALASSGVSVTYIYAGARKIDGVETMPLTDEALARCQTQVNMLYGAFCQQMAINRGLSVEDVRSTEAGTFMGAEAVAAGLADSLSTIEETIMAMTPRQAVPGARLTEEVASPDPATEFLGCAEPEGVPPAFVAVPPVQSLEAPTLGETLAGAQELAQLCTDAGFPGLIVGLLSVGASLPMVNARIAEVRAIATDLQRMNLSALLPVVLKNGMSQDAAREMAFAAKAAAGDAMAIFTANDASAPRASIPAAHDVYARFNNRRA
jgi:signal peptide peptidase SppA